MTEVNHLTALFSLTFGVLQGLDILDPNEVFNSPVPSNVLTSAVGLDSLNANEAFIWGWILMNAVLLSISIMKTVKVGGIMCLRHLFSPFIAAVASMGIATSGSSILHGNLRLIMLCIGFLFSFITNKMIVFSMAQMTFATVQPDVAPLLVVSVVCKYTGVTWHGVTTTLQLLCGWQGVRLVWWSRKAILQLCEKLDINCFTIKQKKS